MNDDVAKCFQTIIEDHEAPKVEKMVDGYSGFLFLDEDGMPLVAMHWEHRLNHMVKRYNEFSGSRCQTLRPMYAAILTVAFRREQACIRRRCST